MRVPVMPWPGVTGPAPALTRIVFNRDSIEWANAATVGDLLLEVPGVYHLARWVHRPARAGQLPGPRRDIGRVLPRWLAVRRRRCGQHCGGSRALLDHPARPRRGRALAGPPSGAPVHPPPRPPRAAIAGRRRHRRPRLLEVRRSVRAAHEVGHRLRARGRLPELADLQRREQRLLQYPGLGAGQLRALGQGRSAVPARPLAARIVRRSSRMSSPTTRSVWASMPPVPTRSSAWPCVPGPTGWAAHST